MCVSVRVYFTRSLTVQKPPGNEQVVIIRKCLFTSWGIRRFPRQLPHFGATHPNGSWKIPQTNTEPQRNRGTMRSFPFDITSNPSRDR